MRIFFDFEFIENGDRHPIIPVSVGMIREDGEEYYAEFHGVDWSRANDWVLDNVKPLLGKRVTETKTKETIAEEIKAFVKQDKDEEGPEFWAYFADYDWVLLCQLYGRMIDLPTGWPMFCLDIKQYMWHMGLSREGIEIPNQEEHDALADARWNAKVFNYLFEYQKSVIKTVLDY